MSYILLYKALFNVVNWTDDNWATVISGSKLNLWLVLWNIHPQGWLQGGRLGVECLGSVLMATIMVRAEKIYLSLGRASQQ